MLMARAVIAKREVRVPVARREATGEAKARRDRRRVPADLAMRAARDVFRSFPWMGGAAPQVPVSGTERPRRELDDPMAPARQVFATIPWTGEKAAPPTNHQEQGSVDSILAGFNWE